MKLPICWILTVNYNLLHALDEWFLMMYILKQPMYLTSLEKLSLLQLVIAAEKLVQLLAKGRYIFKWIIYMIQIWLTCNLQAASHKQ